MTIHQIHPYPAPSATSDSFGWSDQPAQVTTRIRSALFIDFDNVVSNLHKTDPDAAARFAKHPVSWVEKLLRSGLPDGAERDLLVARVYLNPSGSLLSEALGDQPTPTRVHFSKFVRAFVNAGIYVVQTPPLTSTGKSGADGEIVLDALDLLEQPIDEFIVMSADADFTALVRRLRQHDRRVTIVATGAVSAAYRRVATGTIDASDLVAKRPTPRVDVELDLTELSPSCLSASVALAPCETSSE